MCVVVVCQRHYFYRQLLLSAMLRRDLAPVSMDHDSHSLSKRNKTQNVPSHVAWTWGMSQLFWRNTYFDIYMLRNTFVFDQNIDNSFSSMPICDIDSYRCDRMAISIHLHHEILSACEKRSNTRYHLFALEIFIWPGSLTFLATLHTDSKLWTDYDTFQLVKMHATLWITMTTPNCHYFFFHHIYLYHPNSFPNLANIIEHMKKYMHKNSTVVVVECLWFVIKPITYSVPKIKKNKKTKLFLIYVLCPHLPWHF